MIFASSEETELLFEKWSSEQTEVVCIDGESSICGKLSRLDDGRFALLSSYGTGHVVISLKADGLVFAYADESEIPGVPAGVSAFVIARRADDETLRDRLTFITIPNSQSGL